VEVLLYIVIYNTLHRQFCWHIDLVNIVFTFLYALFCDGIHPSGFLKCEEFLDYWSSHNRVRQKSSHGGCMLVMFLNCSYINLKQTAVISFMQCKLRIIVVPCSM